MSLLYILLAPEFVALALIGFEHAELMDLHRAKL